MTQPISSQQFPSQSMSMSTPRPSGSSGMLPTSQGHYEATATRAMQMSGRSPDFIKANLPQATAMQKPNWGLNPSQASQARGMVMSGRSQSFIRSKLGLPSTTPVPGKPG